MAGRNLPPRHARALAIRELHGYDEAEINIQPDIAVDDVANQAIDNNEIEVDQVEDIDDDETISEAENWIFFEDNSDSNDDEEEDQPPPNDDFVLSPDGTEWRTTTNNNGRRPMRNFVAERAGFRRGLRPETRVDSLFVIFDEIFDSVVTYTNIYGRRLAIEKDFVWKRTDREEINAFIGLHILAGKLYSIYFLGKRSLFYRFDFMIIFRSVQSSSQGLAGVVQRARRSAFIQGHDESDAL